MKQSEETAEHCLISQLFLKSSVIAEITKELTNNVNAYNTSNTLYVLQILLTASAILCTSMKLISNPA